MCRKSTSCIDLHGATSQLKAVQCSALNVHEPTVQPQRGYRDHVARFWQFGCSVWDLPREPTSADRVTVRVWSRCSTCGPPSPDSPSCRLFPVPLKSI